MWRLRVILGMAGFLAGPALAHDKIYIVDTFQVLSTSVAGKDMANRLEKLAEEQAAVIRPVAEALDAEKKSLEAQVAILAPEELSKNTRLQDQINSFQTRYRDFELRQRRVAQELKLTQDTGVRKFNETLRPVIQALAKRLKTALILDKRTTLYVSDPIDVTARVIERLNREKKTIDVKWETLKTPSAGQ